MSDSMHEADDVVRSASPTSAIGGAGPLSRTRRDLLRLLAGGIAGSALTPLLARALAGGRPDGEAGARGNAAGLDEALAAAARIERVGLQLYTVRRALAKDIEGTIAAIAAAGVSELEFAGYYDKPSSWWAALMKQHGLSAPATHIALPATDAGWAPHFERATEMGHRWVIVPWIGEDHRTPDGWKRLAARLDSGGALAKQSGLRIGYHNHDFEFASKVDGRTALEFLLTNTDPALVDFELDIYWAVKGGDDPMALLQRYPSRFTCCHVKDAGPPPQRTMMDVGAGTIDFKSLILRGRAGALRHWFIEHDNPADPLASVQTSAAALKAM